MLISGKELEKEKKILEGVNKEVKKKIDEVGETINVDESKLLEFKKYTWENRQDMDEGELATVRVQNEYEAVQIFKKREYFKKLIRIKESPYFASIIFDEESGEHHVIYIGLTYVKDEKLRNIVYDWRSPICSIYYDCEVGSASYEAPKGIIKGDLKRKRQYKIENKKLVRLFDSSINIEDDILQEVLANESSDKMKNIVNTIQSEQNSVIRNTKDRNLIVSGIAGSGKTSVALHRIAFLLYKIKNLTSDKVLIFSPNQIFTEYISNVLPELGEDNTLQTTFNEYLNKQITEFKKVESYVDFIGRYYKNGEVNKKLVLYKQSDEIVNDINNFIKEYLSNVKFDNDIIDDVYTHSKEELDYYLKDRYIKLPLHERIETIATKLSEMNYNGSHKKIPTYRKLLKESANFTLNSKDVFTLFFKSEFAKINMTDKELKEFNKSKEIKYEDALILTYIKGLLEGFYYEKYIEQVVIDEAQDYSYLQYIIISKVFKNASFTILGDVNQTINPYYKYKSLNILSNLFDRSKYIELTKTYRSSEEIIDYTNKILNLNYVCAIRKSNHIPVVLKNDISELKNDVKNLIEKYKSVAIITRDSISAEKIFNLLNDIENISLLTSSTQEFNKTLVIVPAYIAKGLEFDSVIVYSDNDSYFSKEEKNLLYVACTRAQHELIVYEAK